VAHLPPQRIGDQLRWSPFEDESLVFDCLGQVGDAERTMLEQEHSEQIAEWSPPQGLGRERWFHLLIMATSRDNRGAGLVGGHRVGPAVLAVRRSEP
jgi:hypothetical protein